MVEISWSKHRVILDKCKDNQQRKFYIKATKKFGWTKDVLIHQIENQTFEKYLLNQTNLDRVLPETQKKLGHLAIKDHYTFDFLNITEEHPESELEQTLIKNIRAFLLEMGNDYAFVGNQYRLEVGGQEFFIDLLLFHRKLQGTVPIGVSTYSTTNNLPEAYRSLLPSEKDIEDKLQVFFN